MDGNIIGPGDASGVCIDGSAGIGIGCGAATGDDGGGGGGGGAALAGDWNDWIRSANCDIDGRVGEDTGCGCGAGLAAVCGGMRCVGCAVGCGARIGCGAGVGAGVRVGDELTRADPRLVRPGMVGAV